MRKFLLIIILTFITIPLFGAAQADTKGIYLKDFPKESVLHQSLKLRSNDQMGGIIVLPEEPFNEREAARMISRLDKLPTSILTKINREKIQVNLFTDKLTDNPSAEHLKGIIPRGYQSEKKWDDVPGMGGSKIVLVKIGASEKGNGHGSVNLELHELAHSVDRYVYQEIRNDPVFLKIWKQECANLFTGIAYFNTFPEEYFAETFAMYFLGGVSNETLKREAPKTYEFIQALN